MKLIALTVKFEADKAKALNQYADRKDINIQAELSDTLTKLYEKCVPPAVREYIELNALESESDSKKQRKKEPTENESIQQEAKRPNILPDSRPVASNSANANS